MNESMKQLGETSLKQDMQMRFAVEQMRDTLPQMLEYFALKARMQRAYYDSLVLEGFTKEQALSLCSNFVGGD